ncbi:MAG: YggS family pyridoxal phosphate-dependent enzyme [Myxococcota bacterium]
MSIAENLSRIRRRVAAAAERVGRDGSEIVLMGVSKRQPDDRLREAYDSGLRDFGENTVQELNRKAALFAAEGRTPRWHFIGHLQRNKINKLLEYPVHRIHSVDSSKLANALDKRAPAGGLDVLIEVNVGEEEQKGGVRPSELSALLAGFADYGNLRLRGLMSIPPVVDNPRRYFESLRDLRLQHVENPAMTQATELSMGMSGDFEEAIECGSTIVRVGTALFGARPS